MMFSIVENVRTSSDILLDTSRGLQLPYRKKSKNPSIFTENPKIPYFPAIFCLGSLAAVILSSIGDLLYHGLLSVGQEIPLYPLELRSDRRARGGCTEKRRHSSLSIFFSRGILWKRPRKSFLRGVTTANFSTRARRSFPTIFL